MKSSYELYLLLIYAWMKKETNNTNSWTIQFYYPNLDVHIVTIISWKWTIRFSFSRYSISIFQPCVECESDKMYWFRFSSWKEKKCDERQHLGKFWFIFTKICFRFFHFWVNSDSEILLINVHTHTCARATITYSVM